MIWTIIGVSIELFVAVALAIITATTVKLPIFWVIQFLNAQLLFLGWFICLCQPLAKFLWLWWNDEDGAKGKTWWQRYTWLAWRNPVDNFKYVKWTQRPNGPLIYRTWEWRGRQFYYKVGWMSNTHCAMSAGSGRGY